jgi:site-specific recombinase XerD
MTEERDLSEVVSLRQARRQFLNSKRGTVKQSTVRAYRFPTRHFVEYCEKQGIEKAGDINGYVVESWKQARRSEGIKLITLKNNVKHLRVFIKYLERTDLIEYGVADRIEVPHIPDGGDVSEDTLRLERAEDILRYLNTYEYASRSHALFYTMWHTGCRISGAISLDLDDFDPGPSEGGVLQFRNRKAAGTPLKNGNGGERNVTINDRLKQILTDYINGKRERVTDEYGREPLFTTSSGRLTRQRAYKNFTALSRPCVTSPVCPHDREIEDCEAAQMKKNAPSCPSSVSLHPIRRGSITYHIDRGWPKEKLSERVDVSVEVLNKHYDARKKEQERQGRKEFLDLL